MLSNSVQTPALHSQYRSRVARCVFLGQDRADRTFIVNELCQRVSDPHASGQCQIEEASLYLKNVKDSGDRSSLIENE